MDVVDPGKLTKRITIYRETEAVDEEGYPTGKTRTVIRTCWAQVSRPSIREIRSNGSDQTHEELRFLVRYTSTPIERDMMIEYAGHEYQVMYANNYGDADRYIEIAADRRAMK